MNNYSESSVILQRQNNSDVVRIWKCQKKKIAHSKLKWRFIVIQYSIYKKQKHSLNVRANWKRQSFPEGHRLRLLACLHSFSCATRVPAAALWFFLSVWLSLRLFVFFFLQLNFSLFNCLFSVVFPEQQESSWERQQLVPVYQTSTNHRDVTMTRP